MFTGFCNYFYKLLQKRLIKEKKRGNDFNVKWHESGNEDADLRERIESAFQDVFSTPTAPFSIQIFSDDWIDISPGQKIPVIRVILKESKVRKDL